MVNHRRPFYVLDCTDCVWGRGRKYIATKIDATAGEYLEQFLSRSGILERYYQDEQQARGVVTCTHDAGLHNQCSDTSGFLNPSACTRGSGEQE